MMSARFDSFGNRPPRLRPELLDQREDVAVVLGQQLLQMLRAVGLHPFLRLRDRAHAGEVLVNLVVQFLPVGHDHERPVAGHLAQHLLGEEHHRVALAAALRMPEHAQPPLVLLQAASTAAMALFTPRYWWFLATTFLMLPGLFLEHA